MRGAASVVATAFPVLVAVALAFVLVAATAIAVVSCCRCHADCCSRNHSHYRPHYRHHHNIQSLSPCCSLLPRLPCYCPCGCCCHVAPALATVVAAVLPLPRPLLPLPLPPLVPLPGPVFFWFWMLLSSAFSEPKLTRKNVSACKSKLRGRREVGVEKWQWREVSDCLDSGSRR